MTPREVLANLESSEDVEEPRDKRMIDDLSPEKDSERAVESSPANKVLPSNFNQDSMADLQLT